MDLKLDDNGDLELDGNGNLVFVTGAAETAQRIDLSLSTFEGEWSFDTTFGVDWLGSVFVKGVDVSTVNAIVRAVIESKPGVTRILSFEGAVDDATRIYGSSFTALFDDGSTIEGSLSFDDEGRLSATVLALE